MNQLTLGDLMDLVEILLKQGMSMAKVRALPIYLGDDDELNGIHCGWYTNLVDAESNDEDTVYLLEMINDNYGNRINGELKGKAILIS